MKKITRYPDGGKIARAEKFMQKYSHVLEANGKLQELKEAITKKYGNILN